VSRVSTEVSKIDETRVVGGEPVCEQLVFTGVGGEQRPPVLLLVVVDDLGVEVTVRLHTRLGRARPFGSGIGIRGHT
jgi:hypothetical protein